MTDRASVLYNFINKDDWRAVECIDSFSYVFDRLPKRMRLVIDLKLQGYGNKEISVILEVRIKTVQEYVRRAKKRVFNSFI